MMRRLLTMVFCLVLCALAACTVVEPRPVVGRGPAPQYAPDFQARIDNQQYRIDQGITSGSLTRSEAAVLQDNLNWIKNRYARMSADGVLNQREMRRLERMLNDNNEMIYRKKNNPIRRLY